MVLSNSYLLVNDLSLLSNPYQLLHVSVCLSVSRSLFPGSMLLWLLPLHSTPPSAGGISYSALPDYDV